MSYCALFKGDIPYISTCMSCFRWQLRWLEHTEVTDVHRKAWWQCLSLCLLLLAINVYMLVWIKCWENQHWKQQISWENQKTNLVCFPPVVGFSDPLPLFCAWLKPVSGISNLKCAYKSSIYIYIYYSSDLMKLGSLANENDKFLPVYVIKNYTYHVKPGVWINSYWFDIKLIINNYLLLQCSINVIRFIIVWQVCYMLEDAVYYYKLFHIYVFYRAALYLCRMMRLCLFFCHPLVGLCTWKYCIQKWRCFKEFILPHVIVTYTSIMSCWSTVWYYTIMLCLCCSIINVAWGYISVFCGMIQKDTKENDTKSNHFSGPCQKVRCDRAGLHVHATPS